jgi:hypothetical protein
MGSAALWQNRATEFEPVADAAQPEETTMTIAKTLIAATLSIGVIGGATAANASPYTPSPYPLVVRSPQACDAYARDYANWAAGNRGVRIAAGGLIGAGLGALAGGFFFGTPIAGAVVGGGLGLGAGAVIGQPQWQAEYNNAYGACVYGQPLVYPY